jgi:hypothetical protein
MLSLILSKPSFVFVIKLGIDHDKSDILIQRCHISEFATDTSVYENGVVGIDPTKFAFGVFGAFVEFVEFQSFFNFRIGQIKRCLIIEGEDIEPEPLDILPGDAFISNHSDQLDDLLIPGTA